MRQKQVEKSEHAVVRYTKELSTQPPADQTIAPPLNEIEDSFLLVSRDVQGMVVIPAADKQVEGKPLGVLGVF